MLGVMPGVVTQLTRRGREVSTVLRRKIAAPPALVWALVADTNRFDRASGLVPGKYEFRLLDEGDPDSRARVAHAKQMGFDIRWIEPPYEWCEARFVRGERQFLSGPVMRGGFSVELTADGDGTAIEARAYIAGEGALFSVVSLVMRSRFKKALASYLGAIEGVLAQTHATLGYDWNAEPPQAAARRALMTSQQSEITAGVRTANSEADLDYRARRFEAAPIDDALRARVLDLLRTRPDEELGQIRPYEVARAWGVPRPEVLRAFLYAARAGLVELQWQLNCPTCRVGSETADSLGSIGKQAHCELCNINYDLDFAQHVEAAFKVSPSVRKVETAVYCASSPWFRPHVFAQLRVEANASTTIECTLPTGALLARTLGRSRRATIEVVAEEQLAAKRESEEVRVVISDDALTMGPAVAPATTTRVVVDNQTDKPVVILFERAGWSADVVLGSAIASFPDFLDLFGTEAPAAGVELTVGALTLLFSDLTGSTALYERVGDAAAFAIVQDHFRQMTTAIAAHQGAVIKTMGDAVMASFTSPASAARAAFDMIDACEGAHAGIGLSVKIGLHEGPCLAVRANERLDYFGTTVNVAARLQALAHGSEVVMLADLMHHADVAKVVAERSHVRRTFEASLKGIREVQRLVGARGDGKGAAEEKAVAVASAS